MNPAKENRLELVLLFNFANNLFLFKARKLPARSSHTLEDAIKKLKSSTFTKKNIEINEANAKLIIINFIIFSLKDIIKDKIRGKNI